MTNRIGGSVKLSMRRAGSSVARVCALGGIFAAYACVHGTVAGIPTNGFEWVATWEGPPQLTEPGNMPPAPGISTRAVRQVIHVTLGGSRWRFKFSNEFGDGPLTIEGAGVARSIGHDTIEAPSRVALRFNGAASITIPVGQTVTSDEIQLVVAPLSNIAITTSFGAVPSHLTGHPGSRTTSYVVSADRADARELPGATPVDHWYVISDAEVRAVSGASTVVVLGNSIADGRGSGTNKNDRWPDNLARRLAAKPATTNVGVLNAGIGGNAVVHGGLGPTALERLDRDVLAQRGARWVILSEGVNDIGGARPDSGASVARALIDAYRQIIARARERRMKVYGATILPFGGSQYGSADHEAARQTVNAWIRTSGAFDAVIDLDATMRSPLTRADFDPTRTAATIFIRTSTATCSWLSRSR